MTDAAEQGNTLARRDLGVGGAGFPFPPLRRTIRPYAPEAAAERWPARFRELAGSSIVGDAHARCGAANAPAAAEVETSR